MPDAICNVRTLGLTSTLSLPSAPRLCLGVRGSFCSAALLTWRCWRPLRAIHFLWLPFRRQDRPIIEPSLVQSSSHATFENWRGLPSYNASVMTCEFRFRAMIRERSQPLAAQFYFCCKRGSEGELERRPQRARGERLAVKT